MSTDEDVQAAIEELEAERERLRAEEGDPDAQVDHANRLEAIRVELDRLWDLKRRRAAIEEYGGDPDTATERSAEEVEDYLG